MALLQAAMARAMREMANRRFIVYLSFLVVDAQPGVDCCSFGLTLSERETVLHSRDWTLIRCTSGHRVGVEPNASFTLAHPGT